ncbi:MAG: 30S ribosomal protein S1 [Planctomycetota bacterium]|nr:MAG: 30S ribosomal protein S1 [Planctomycetota bacterium]
MPKDALEAALQEAIGPDGEAKLKELYEHSVQDVKPDKIVRGRVLNIVGDDVIVDVGYKSEGVIPLDHWKDRDEVDIGDSVDVLLEAIEDESGLVILSKKKADRQKGWERVIEQHQKGDTVKGKVLRKIKGGLLVDIGVPVFLPASQIDIRRVNDVNEWIDREIECKIIKIDEARMNIVVSRRKLLEEEREQKKKELLEQLHEGAVVKGVVKNLAEFGAFIDLGGIDGLCHITDMSWGRVTHPSEVVKINDEVEVKVLKIDPKTERISLGIKQLTESPWNNIQAKYPVGAKFTGTVVNILSYGAFVKLEEGVEGLVHVSEMSWTKRVNHPSEVVQIGDKVEVVVLDVNPQKQEISLGMKQVEVNPWTLVEDKYPPGKEVTGVVRNLTNYGAFVELEEGIDGLLHVSDLSWTKKVVHPSEMLERGQEVKAVVIAVDQEKKRIALGLKQLEEDPWERLIPNKYATGEIVKGVVTKVTNFGVFVELEDGLEGLLHISELADRKVDNPQQIVTPGDRVHVKVIKVDLDERKIGLSLRQALEEGAPPPERGELPPTAEPSSGEAVDAESSAAESEASPSAEAEAEASEAPPAAESE